jgi:Flp pilus assembly pilin Flp
MRQLLRRLRRRDEGEGLTEYALVFALVAICLIVILRVGRNAIGNTLGTASNDVERSSTSSYGSPSAPGPALGGYSGGGGGGGGGYVPPDDGGSGDEDENDPAPTDSLAIGADVPTFGLHQ